MKFSMSQKRDAAGLLSTSKGVANDAQSLFSGGDAPMDGRHSVGVNWKAGACRAPVARAAALVDISLCAAVRRRERCRDGSL